MNQENKMIRGCTETMQIVDTLAYIETDKEKKTSITHTMTITDEEIGSTPEVKKMIDYWCENVLSESNKRDVVITDGKPNVEYLKNIFNVNTLELRKFTQAIEICKQSKTLQWLYSEMDKYWEDLKTPDKQCPIVEQTASKIKYQLVNLYAIRIIKELRSVIGMDLVSMVIEDVTSNKWKLDCLILNISSRKVTSHKDLFTLMLVNLFGISTKIVEYSFNPTYNALYEIMRDFYDIKIPLDLIGEKGLKEPQVEDLETGILYLITGQVKSFYLA